MDRPYLKVLSIDLSAPHGRWGYRRWMPRIDDIRPCERGYHLCLPTAESLLAWWRDGLWVWEAEVDGDIIKHGNKIVCQSARIVSRLAWDTRIARLYAADCAEHVLHYYEALCSDSRPRDAIAATRAYAHGEIGAAARAAARDAAMAAARAAARDAAMAAARAAAWAAARDAARDAARAAAWDAARDAERAAARDAAWAAARAAAWDAAWAAERQWQTDRMWQYLRGEVGCE